MAENPYEPPQEGDESRSLVGRINDALGLGFGLLDPWVICYAAGTMICGVGAGMFADNLLRTRLVILDRLSIVAIVLLATGTLIANVAHSALKKAAKLRKCLPHDER